MNELFFNGQQSGLASQTEGAKQTHNNKLSTIKSLKVIEY